MPDNENYFKEEFIPLDRLYLDPNNYRLLHKIDTSIDETLANSKDVANRTYNLLVGNKEENIQDLIKSFKTNGFLPIDQIQVRKLNEKDFIVIEGNRRVATLKYLYQNNIDRGNLNSTIFDNVPVVIYKDVEPIHYLTLMALKHINGNKKWEEWNQAKLLEEFKMVYKLSDDEICDRIGISKTDLRRKIRALALVALYKKSDYGDQFDGEKFVIFQEVVKSSGLKDWLNWDNDENTSKNSANLDKFFSWISKDSDDEDIELSPIINNRDDVRNLAKILKDKEAMKMLENSRNLNSAYQSSALLFAEKIKDVINSMTANINILNQVAINSEQLNLLEKILEMLNEITLRARNNNRLNGVESFDVFYERIDRHLSSLKIHSYKSLKNININKLSKINLVTGINNAGKTSFLEAVYLLCKQNDVNGLVEIMRRRGKVSEERLIPEWFVQQITKPFIVEGEFDNKKCKVSIDSFAENEGIDLAYYLKTIKISAEFEDKAQESITRIYKNKGRETKANGIKILCKSIFNSPFFLNESKYYMSFYDKSFKTKLLQKVLLFIKEKIVNSITDIRLVDEFNRFLVDDDVFKQAMDLTSYGEGLQRIFFTSLIFASAENGIILIDEFENALHVELIENYSSFIYSLADEFNVQVFLTFHSKECIDSFIKNIPDEKKDDFSFYAFVKDGEKNTAVREFNGENFHKLLEAGDVDLRMAK
jgi:AAA15 family ATPase/GTPase